MNPTTQSRSPYWDIVKGIGIIAIVLGHSCYFAVGFVSSLPFGAVFLRLRLPVQRKEIRGCSLCLFRQPLCRNMAPIRFLYLLLRAAPQFLCKPGAVSEPGAV